MWRATIQNVRTSAAKHDWYYLPTRRCDARRHALQAYILLAHATCHRSTWHRGKTT
jgi:hypothetical protein